MKYKAIISDFDGTLVDQESKLSSQLLGVIRDYITLGGHFCLATGRDFAGDIVQACRNLGLEGPQIASGGAEIVEAKSGRVIVGHYINNQVAQTIINRLQHKDLNLIVSQQGFLYTSKPEFSGYYKDITKPLDNLTVTKTPKIRITFRPEQLPDIQAILDAMQQEFIHDVVIHQSNTVRSTGFDITSPYATKHLAVLELTKLLDLDPLHTVGMGDGYNDYPLLTACGYKVAMAHSPQELLDIANYIAPPHANGGPIAAIEHIMSL